MCKNPFPNEVIISRICFVGKEPFPGSTLEEITEGIEAERERRKSGDKFIPLSTEPAKYITLPGKHILRDDFIVH